MAAAPSAAPKDAALALQAGNTLPWFSPAPGPGGMSPSAQTHSGHSMACPGLEMSWTAPGPHAHSAMETLSLRQCCSPFLASHQQSPATAQPVCPFPAEERLIHSTDHFPAVLHPPPLHLSCLFRV